MLEVLEETVESGTCKFHDVRAVTQDTKLCDLPKTMMLCEFVTLRANAAGPGRDGSWKAELVVNGVGGAGVGWKYGYF